jgi:hypothetical protein
LQVLHHHPLPAPNKAFDKLALGPCLSCLESKRPAVFSAGLFSLRNRLPYLPSAAPMAPASAVAATAMEAVAAAHRAAAESAAI